VSIGFDTFTEGAAFEIVTEHGDRAFAHDVEAAVVAARELRRDHRSEGMVVPTTVYVMHEGMCIKTIGPSERV
jgi:hypothetical protein